MANPTSLIGTLFSGLEATAGIAIAGSIGGAAVAAYSTANPSSYVDTSNIIFPSDLINFGAGREFYITFFFYKYQRPSVSAPPFLAPQGSITLPLPSQLIDTQSVSYQPESFDNPAVGAAVDAYVKANQSQSGQSAINNLSATTLSTAFAGLQGAGVAVAKGALDTAGSGLVGENNLANKFLQVGGLSVNPYLQVLFKGPTFKRHMFTWKFIPNNQKEADTLKYILNKFRYHQLPDTNSGLAGVLLNYPDMVVPLISPAGYMYSFKRCVIDTAGANFSPGLTPGFTVAGSPSSVQFTLSLIEIEYWLKRDLNNTDLNYTVEKGNVQQWNLDSSGATSASSTTTPNFAPGKSL